MTANGRAVLWFGRAAAGLLLGFVIALALSGLFAWFGPAGLAGGPGKTQFNMWLIAPVWGLVLSFVFLFPTARSAWLWLGAAALLLAGFLAAGRMLAGAL